LLGGSPAFLINLKAYSDMKNKVQNDKREKEKGNIHQSLNTSKRSENSNNGTYSYSKQAKKKEKEKKFPQKEQIQISKLKEKAQKDIESIEKEISQELSLLGKNNEAKLNKHKKTHNKSSSYNEQEITEIKHSNKVKCSKIL